MEKERFFCVNSQSPKAVELNCGAAAAGQLPQPFLNVGWEQLMQRGARFESALGSLPSLPPSSNQLAGVDSALVCELVDRLGGVCSSGDISTATRYQNAGSSRYSALLGSPPKLNLAVMDHQPMPGTQMVGGQFAAPFAANLGFVERAARLSCFGTRCYDGLPGQFGLPDTGKLSSVPSSQSPKANGALPLSIPDDGKETASTPTPEEMDFSNGQEAATPPDTMPTGSAANNAKKRKAATKGKGKAPPLSSSNTNPPKEMEEENYEAKRCKTAETGEADRTVRAKPEQSSDNDGGKQGKENNAKPPEPPKDYIHVRARRGQATDSHSLAERVRREKISERMKLLQDLVPGCNKITGKALMLDEIINYVQSLQRQVEFLSTKLATLNPHVDFNIDTFLRKDTHEEDGRLAEQVYPRLDLASTAFSYSQQPQSLGMEAPLNDPSVSSLDPLDGFAGAIPQLGNFWEDDLQYIVQSAFS